MGKNIVIRYIVYTIVLRSILYAIAEEYLHKYNPRAIIYNTVRRKPDTPTMKEGIRYRSGYVRVTVRPLNIVMDNKIIILLQTTSLTILIV